MKRSFLHPPPPLFFFTLPTKTVNGVACSGLSDSGEEAKVGGAGKRKKEGSHSLNSADPTISEPGTGH